VIVLDAYAKINLTLETLCKRKDGYHEIRSVLQTISLSDTIYFEKADSMTFECSFPSWVAESSLVSKAAKELKVYRGSAEGARITIKKRIPLSSGLGGDSSDAATVLCGLNLLWGLGLSVLELSDIAERLGSDVPFFLHGGTVFASGRGEVLQPISVNKGLWIVLLFPEVSRLQSKTSILYSLIQKENMTSGKATEGLVSCLKSGETLSPEYFFNVFDGIAKHAFQGIEYYRSEFVRVAKSPVWLAGAGPTLFTVFFEESRARETFKSLHSMGMNACVAQTQPSNQ